MYRERADIQCYDERANASDLETADKRVDLTIATKKAEAERADWRPRELPENHPK